LKKQKYKVVIKIVFVCPHTHLPTQKKAVNSNVFIEFLNEILIFEPKSGPGFSQCSYFCCDVIRRQGYKTVIITQFTIIVYIMY